MPNNRNTKISPRLPKEDGIRNQFLKMLGLPVLPRLGGVVPTFVFLWSLWALGVSFLLIRHNQSNASPMVQQIVFGFGLVLLAAVLLYLGARRYATGFLSSSELTELILNASPIGAIVSDENGVILMVNHPFVVLSGYDVDDVVGKTDMDLGLWAHPEDREVLLQQLRSEGVTERFESSLNRRDDSLHSVSISARRISINNTVCTITYVEDTTHQHEISRKVEELTRFDAMTGLPNQQLLIERLNQLIVINNRSEYRLAVLNLVLGKCPCTSTAIGNSGSNELLRCIAMRLRGNLRETDTLAVLQRGEFGIVLAKIEHERDLLAVVNKLQDSVNEPISVTDAEFQLHVHIGIALFPADGRTAEVLLQQAHLAMTQAQVRVGENHFQFYSEAMNKEAVEQLQVESSILRGIREGEFFVCYQPLLSSDGKHLIGMEALTRWQHPTLGLVSPDKFIPVAEANGTIIPLGELVLELALRNCKYWRESTHPKLTVAVNVSARQLKDRQFADRVAQLLELTGLSPDALCLELTESMLMEHSNDNIDQIFRLKELGIELAIDDFGTGYSSLAHLKHLPVDSIKIDRSFVRDLESNLDDRAIVTAIIAMARSLHLKVVAEGVETIQQHTLLQELGCDFMQGYLFAKPLERKEFELYVQGRVPVVLTDEDASSSDVTPCEDMQELNQSDDRQLQYVSDITMKIFPLSPGDRLNTALLRFQTDKLLQVLPIVDRHRVVGILNRSEFIEEQVVGRIGYAFHINHSKKVRDLMQVVPLVIDSEASIEEAASALHGSFGSMRLENICVARRGIYQGVLDVRTLVEAITALNLKLAKGANPLTGLPGNESIQREINRRLESRVAFDIAYIDIDHFKPYNDFYGFERGDLVIRAVGDILKGYADDLHLLNFCGHIGGDDFIIITSHGYASALCCRMITEFEARLPVLHGSSDYAKGCYTSLNRKGELETFSLLSLSVAIISTGQLLINSYPQLASLASDIKKYAKKVKGSSVVVKQNDGAPEVVVGM